MADGAAVLAMAYLQVVTMASSLSSVRHFRLLHRRAYSIIAEFLARWKIHKNVQREPSLQVSQVSNNIDIAVSSIPSSRFLETDKKDSAVEHM